MIMPVLRKKKKCLVGLILRGYVQSGLMQFLELCLNKFSLGWLKLNFDPGSDFSPKGWRVLNISSREGRAKLIKGF